jgi:hypothetical protein
MGSQNLIDEQREQLTAADYQAAGVDAPKWSENPLPSLETWRLWRVAENRALEHKLAMASEAGA